MNQPFREPEPGQSRLFPIVAVKWFAVTGFIAALAALSAGVARYLVLAISAIRQPFGIDYGEGIVWQQMRMIMAGHAYGPIQGFPAIVFHYPPIYHVVSAFAASVTGMDQLEAGRAVSVAATIILAGLITLIALALREPKESRRAYLLGGVASAAILLTTKPIVMWSYLMRVDMLSLAFSFAGVWLGIQALKRPIAIHAASLCFVAAIFTKQTALAAPIAVFSIILIVRPRTAIAGITTGALIALAGVAIMIRLTNGGFLNHILLYNINRFDTSQVKFFRKGLAPQIGFIIVAIWAVTRRFIRIINSENYSNSIKKIKENYAATAMVILLTYLAITTIMLFLVFKSGAAINYFLEWISIVSVFSGLAFTEFTIPQSGAPGRCKPHPAAYLVLWIVALQAILLLALIKTDYKVRLRDAVDLAQLVTTIRNAPAPVIGDDMVGILRAGKSVMWEPSIFAELASTGVWDERPFIALIRARRFAFFMDEEHLDDPKESDARYTPAVRQAIIAAYPQVRYLAQYEIHLPAGPLPPYAVRLPMSPPPDHR